jgi:dolichol-phosphate mannosyltransferase
MSPIAATQSARVSVVLPAYNEEKNLPAAYAELSEVLDGLGVRWEMIVADDGSTDGTWDQVCSLHSTDQRVKGVRLSRNFGHQQAMLAGLQHATGDAVITMDADLQHPPAIIPLLLERWKEGYKVVNTIRRDPPSTSRFKRSTSALYYRVFSALSGVPMRRGTSDCRLLDRQALDELLVFDEASLFFRGLVMWLGHPIAWVPFDCRDRLHGRSKYSLRKMALFAIDGVTSFSVTPLRFGVILGLATSVLAFGELVYAVVMKLGFDQTVPGWASAVSVISFLFGILFILLGLMGEYLGRILIEVRRRPRYLLRDRVGTELSMRDRLGEPGNTRPPRDGPRASERSQGQPGREGLAPTRD